MAYLIGTRKNDDIYVRCTHCGDSPHRQHIAHLSINITNGLYYCHRCNSAGKLDTISLIALLSEYGSDIVAEVEQCLNYSLHNIQSTDTRHTVLSSDIVSLNNEKYRRWASRDTKGCITGYYLRHTERKQSLFDGIKSFGYTGSSLSKFSIRVVEGVYDCVYENDVCLFGRMSIKSLKKLSLYPMILAPDSDCVHLKNNLQITRRMVERASKYCNIKAIEVFSYPFDPSDYFKDNRRGELYSVKEFLRASK